MTSRLTRNQVDFIIDMLERARRAQPLSRFERIAYPLLRVFIGGYVVSFVAMMVAFGFAMVERGNTASSLFVVFAVSFFAFGILAIALMAINLVHARRFRDRLRLLSQFGLVELLDQNWRLEGGRRKAGRFWSALLFIFGVIGSLLGFLTLVVFLIVAVSVGTDTNHIFWGALAITTVTLSSLVLVGNYFLHRVKARHEMIDEVAHLRELLEKQLEEEGDEITLDASIRRKLAAVERAQIFDSRTEAIQRSLGSSARTGFAVLKSEQLTRQQAALEPAGILAVERAINALSESPQTQGVEATESQGVFRFPVPEATSTLVYEVNEDRRTIRLVGLASDEGPTPVPPPEISLA